LESFPSSTKASGQYLNSMLAVQDARKRGYDEALLLNQDGFVAEGSGQNIFIVKDNKVITNGENASILMGITRETIIQLCHDLKIDIQITNITYEMLLNADEAFFTGTASEITPISSVDDSYIGNGKLGDITLQLKNLYLDIIHGKVNQYTHWLSPIQYAKYLTPSVAE
jgi:branched-chain amino acid aminotransferase